MKVTKAPVTSALARTVILFAALSALCLLLASCGSDGPASAKTASTTRAVAAHGVFSRVLDQPYVTVTGGQFYVTWQDQPSHNGVIGSGVWAAQPTGMQGFVQRYSTATLTPDRGTAVEGSNGVGVAVAGGLAWMLRVGPYAAAAGQGGGVRIRTIPVPPACRT